VIVVLFLPHGIVPAIQRRMTQTLTVGKR
jgi:hypothetical protein